MAFMYLGDDETTDAAEDCLAGAASAADRARVALGEMIGFLEEAADYGRRSDRREVYRALLQEGADARDIFGAYFGDLAAASGMEIDADGGMA